MGEPNQRYMSECSLRYRYIFLRGCVRLEDGIPSAGTAVARTRHDSAWGKMDVNVLRTLSWLREGNLVYQDCMTAGGLLNQLSATARWTCNPIGIALTYLQSHGYHCRDVFVILVGTTVRIIHTCGTLSDFLVFSPFGQSLRYH